MILINRIETTQAPWDEGEEPPDSEGVFFAEDCPYTFLELVRLLRDHTESSRSPARGETFEWYSSDWNTDYRTGEETQTSVHYSCLNKPHNARYWRLAAIAAGIVKRRGERNDK